MTIRVDITWGDGFTTGAAYESEAFQYGQPSLGGMQEQDAQREWLHFVMVKMMQDMLRQQRSDWQMRQLEFQREMQNEMMHRARRLREREREAQRDKTDAGTPAAFPHPQAR